MSLISQPGSDYQLTLDAGNARDIMLLLMDVYAVLDHLYLDGTRGSGGLLRSAGLDEDRPMIEFTLDTDNWQRR